MNFANILTIFFISFFTLGKNQPLNSSSDYASTGIKATTNNLRVYKLNHVWTIENFREQSFIFSPEFSVNTNDTLTWYYYFEPDSALRLCFNSRCKDKTVFARYRLSLLNDEQNEIWSQVYPLREFNDTITEGGYTRCAYNYIPKWRLNSPNNKLKISCNITYLPFNGVIHRQDDCQSNTSENTVADVVLLVNGKRYPVHKNILAARSPLFAFMFEDDATEDKIRCISITDMSEEVFDEILRYIYTGRCGNLEKLANDLLIAADKYGLDELKVICVNTLCNKTLSVENATNTLIWADKYGVNELKSKIIEFIAAKYSEVSNTAAWKEAIKENPQFVHQVCQDLCYRLSSIKNHNDKIKKLCF